MGCFLNFLAREELPIIWKHSSRSRFLYDRCTLVGAIVLNEGLSPCSSDFKNLVYLCAEKEKQVPSSEG